MRRNPLLAGGAVVLALILFAFFFVFPRGAEVRSVEAEVASAESELDRLTVALSAIQQIDPAAIEVELAAYREQIPSTTDLPGLIESLVAIAKDSGVEVTSISFSGVGQSSAGGVASMPVSLSGSGTYFDIARFVFSLDQMRRLTKTSSISLSPQGEGGLLAFSLATEVYTTDLSAGPGSAPEPGPEVGA